MTSIEAKKTLLHYFLYDRYSAMATTEFNINGYLADLFVLDKKLFSTEIEIKVNKSDLMSEIYPIRSIVNNTVSEKSINKHWKHVSYINYNKDSDNKKMNIIQNLGKKSIPNKFYFAVPKELREITEKGIENTPYGLIIIDYKDWTTKPKIVVKGKKIHNNILNENYLFGYLRKLSLENLNLRNKL